MPFSAVSSTPRIQILRLIWLWCCCWSPATVAGFVAFSRSSPLAFQPLPLDTSSSSSSSMVGESVHRQRFSSSAAATAACQERRVHDRDTRLFLSSEEKESTPDDGINLAAEFLKMAKKKGIELQAEDLLDDDEEDEDDDDEEEIVGKRRLQQQQQQSQAAAATNDDDDEEDDEEEMNIPQGAINAFLGYDTGNVGEKLAGNVTLTNDQLYSEVKERVLESAGGFLDFVRGAEEEEDDDEDDDDDDSVVDEVLEITKLSSKKEYQPPLLVPDSDLTAGEVVITVLEALLHNDVPTPNRGVEILFGYSSPGSQIKNEVGLTPAEYADFLKDTEYKVLFEHQDVTIDKGDYSFDGKKAYFTARLRVGEGPLDFISVNFILSTTGVEEDACWLIDSILIRPQAMRRRRRR